jgi:hypothetical protein
MTTEHTPGPWEIGRVSAPNTGATPIRWKGGNLAWACGKDSAHGFDEATARANARLMAAAPDLLAELNLAERVIRSAVQESAGRVKAEIVGGWEFHAGRIREAIARAEGRAE